MIVSAWHMPRTEKEKLVKLVESGVYRLGRESPEVREESRTVEKKLRMLRVNLGSMNAEISATQALMELCEKLEELGARKEAEAVEAMARAIFFSDSTLDNR